MSNKTAFALVRALRRRYSVPYISFDLTPVTLPTTVSRMTLFVVSPIKFPFVTVHATYSDAITQLVAMGASACVHGTQVIGVEGKPVARLHAVTRYESIACLKAASELDASGYTIHADAIRHRVGQAEAHNDSDYWHMLDETLIEAEEALDEIARDQAS